MFWCTLITVFCVLLNATFVCSSSYKAAVIYFAPKTFITEYDASINKETAQQNMMINLNALGNLVESVSAQGAEIVVFPEYAITGAVNCSDPQCKKTVRVYAENIPDIVTGVSIEPCTDSEFDNRPILRSLSCTAQLNNIVLVANMPDDQGELLLNANVIFEANGVLVSKYYKQHLFGIESKFFDISNEHRYTTFTTSFDVKFSTFICNDILFCDPPLEMVKRGIKNFIFTTFWGNRYPHYMSISVHHGWSWRNKVNILSAGIHMDVITSNERENFYSRGSGIYSAGKPLDYYLSGFDYIPPSGNYLIADVPLEPGRVDNIGSLVEYRLSELKTHDTMLNYKYLDPSSTSQEAKYHSDIFGTLECKVEYEFSHLATGEKYALAASIFRDKVNQPLTYALCSLSRRPDAEQTLQSSSYTADSTFRYLKLNGSFLQYPKITVMPFVLGDKLHLFDPSLFILEEDALILQGTEQSILAANLWGKIFGENDGYCSSTSTTEETSRGEILHMKIKDFLIIISCLFIICF